MARVRNLGLGVLAFRFMHLIVTKGDTHGHDESGKN